MQRTRTKRPPRRTPMREPQPAGDLEARARAVRHEGSVLVQAPAGSGKTTLLVQRYLRVLATVEAPERILALTFTRRAAEEMRARVARALQAARSADCPAGLEPLTWELAVGAARHLDALGMDLGVHASRLRIETIDAFNAWLAGNLPIGAGLGARSGAAENAGEWYREAARRTLAHEEEDEYGAAVERVLAQSDQRYEMLARLIAEMLPSRERWLPLLAGGLRAAAPAEQAQLRAVRQRFDQDLALLIARLLQSARQVIGAERIEAASQWLHAAAQGIVDAQAPLAPWRADGSVLRAEPEDAARWRAFAAVALTKSGSVRARLTAGEGFPAGAAQKQPMQQLLEEIAGEPPAVRALQAVAGLPPMRYGDEDWLRVRDVAQVLVLAAAQLERVLREQGAADFPAVSIAAQRALGSSEAPTDLALRLDYRLQHILIDEFQDTSGAQLELLRVLTAGWQDGDGRSVFCVGDPMQSIYGFRQAEVRAFLELAEDGIGGVRFTVLRLTQNFRAAPPLVAWINASFARILPPYDDRERGAIAFRPSTAAQSQSPAPPAMRLCGHATRVAEAEAIAERIATARAAHPAWRIAVLVRARAHAQDIAGALRRRGVAFHALDIEPLENSAVVRDLIMLARALLHRGDRTAWFALLRAPWAGLDLADLLKLSRAAPILCDALADDAVLGALSAAGRARCLRLRAALEPALRDHGRGGFARSLERSWLALGGPACAANDGDLQDARTAIVRLRELEQRGLPDPADMAQAFDKLFARAETRSTVEIMTIHKAKGLEFDLVVVPALDRAILRRRDEFLMSLQFSRAGRDGMVMAARPAVGADGDRLFEFLREQARDGADLEAERLLYVACTRAKAQLHLTAVIGAQPPRAGSLLAVLWAAAGADFTAPQEGAPQIAPPAGAAVLQGGPLRRVPVAWLAPPPGGDFEPRALPAGAELGGAPAPAFDWAGESARQVGILVHAELQALDLQRADARAMQARTAHYRRWLTLRGVPAELVDSAARRAAAALAATLDDPRGRWILQGGRREDRRECAYSAVCDGELLRVVFDRSFIDETGVRWVIDYKTSEHMGGAPQTFLDREVERYGAQMARYAALARRLGPQPVRLGLYFPLMRGWREWDG